LGLLSVIVPMGLFNLLGSLQNIESAEAAGDAYDTRSSLAMNGLGTFAAAAFGSCFPTTIYIGHPGWKGLGARAGYSIINGVAITLLCLTGTVALVQSLVPIEAGVAIVLWIGVVITAQAFVACPASHAPAVAIGLFPAIAAWGLTVVQGAFLVASGATMQQLLGKDFATQVNGFLLHGLISMERGYIFTCVILATIAVELIEKRFRRAACWAGIGALFALVGLTHGYQLAGNFVDFLFIGSTPMKGAMTYHAHDVAIGYATMAIALLFFATRSGQNGAADQVDAMGSTKDRAAEANSPPQF
jgi:AGZA family xanthine/uracil permease-like MFS transporter